MLSLISDDFVFDPLYPDLGNLSMAICSCMRECGSSYRFGLLVTERPIFLLSCHRRHYEDPCYTITRHGFSKSSQHFSLSREILC